MLASSFPFSKNGSNKVINIVLLEEFFMAFGPINLDNVFSLNSKAIYGVPTLLQGAVLGAGLTKFMGLSGSSGQWVGQTVVFGAGVIQTFVGPIVKPWFSELIDTKPGTNEGKILYRALLDGTLTVAGLSFVKGASYAAGKPYLGKVGDAAVELLGQFNRADGWPNLIGKLGKVGLIGGVATVITFEVIKLMKMNAQQLVSAKSGENNYSKAKKNV